MIPKGCLLLRCRPLPTFSIIESTMLLFGCPFFKDSTLKPFAWFDEENNFDGNLRLVTLVALAIRLPSSIFIE